MDNEIPQNTPYLITEYDEIHLLCYGCFKDNLPELVVVGEPEGDESCTTYLCKQCVLKALSLFTREVG